jgi:ParB-like chromosome segregation protein Spo0J
MSPNKPQIEIVGVERLIPYARNSRTHDDAQVAQIAASIREFGFTNPVLIDADHGIIAGHGRVLAARKLGLTEVPCIRLTHLTETQKRAYIIADNKLALNAGWDEEALRLELGDLRAANVDLSLTGFDGDEIESFLNLPESEDDYPQSSAAEIDVDGMNMECQCPKCGFEFDPKKK